MAQTSAGRSPIPPANNGDPEDVAWALSTAEAMYARGDRGEALKWLRRAAEAGTEGKIGDRAVQLARAAVELAGMLGPASSSNPPRRPVPSPRGRPARARTLPLPVARPSSGARSSVDFLRAARRSVSSARRGERGVSPRGLVGRARHARHSGSRRARARAGASPARRFPGRLPVLSRAPDFSIPNLLHDDLADPPEEKTRIGVPAYQAGAMAAADAPVSPKVADPSLRPTQAMRVIVWRGPDGVRVAPYGTHVAAIAVDALLVALNPAADLAAWLSKK